MRHEDNHEMLTVAEVALTLRCSAATVYRHIQAGSLAATRTSRHGNYRIRRSALAAYLKSNRGPS
jgi:excisionase family DNA binding protein